MHPEPTATYPNWVRIALGFVVAAANALLVSHYVHIGPEESALITSVILVLGTIGVTPPSPSSFKMSQAVSVVLTVAAIIANYLLVSVWNPSVELLVVLSILLSLLASIGIVPPQVRRT